MSKSLFLILILSVNTVWAETRRMVCVPDPRLFVNISKSLKIQPYTITIKYDTNKLAKKNNYKMFDIAQAKFSSMPWNQAYFTTFPAVESIDIEQYNINNTFDSNRLDSVSGNISYTDSKLSTEERAYFKYHWELYRFYIDKSSGVRSIGQNPYTKKPLGTDEYLLKNSDWEGGTNRAIKLLENNGGRIPYYKGDFHFIPGLHICSQWTTDKKALDAFIREQEAAAPQIVKQYKDDLAKPASAGESQSADSPPLSIHVPEQKDEQRSGGNTPSGLGGDSRDVKNATVEMQCKPAPELVAKTLNRDKEIQPLEDELDALYNMTASPSVSEQIEVKLNELEDILGVGKLNINPDLTYVRLTKPSHDYKKSDYEYKIDIRYDPDIFSEKANLYQQKKISEIVADEFIKVKFSRISESAVVNVIGVNPKPYDALNFIFGETSYIDNSTVLKNGKPVRLTYEWTLSRTKVNSNEVLLNPYSGKPLMGNEYILTSGSWRGNNAASAKKRDFHFLSGLHRCSWTIVRK